MSKTNYSFLKKLQDGERKKDNSKKMQIAIVGGAPLSQRFGTSFTGFGEDGILQPDNPAKMVETDNGTSMLHEGELEIRLPDGRTTIIPAHEIPQQMMQKLEKSQLNGPQNGGSNGGQVQGGIPTPPQTPNVTLEQQKFNEAMSGFKSGGDFQGPMRGQNITPAQTGNFFTGMPGLQKTGMPGFQEGGDFQRAPQVRNPTPGPTPTDPLPTPWKTPTPPKPWPTPDPNPSPFNVDPLPNPVIDPNLTPTPDPIVGPLPTPTPTPVDVPDVQGSKPVGEQVPISGKIIGGKVGEEVPHALGQGLQTEEIPGRPPAPTPEGEEPSQLQQYLNQLAMIAAGEGQIGQQAMIESQQKFKAEEQAAKEAQIQAQAQSGITGREALTGKAMLARDIGAAEAGLEGQLRKQQDDRMFAAAQQLPGLALQGEQLQLAKDQFGFSKEQFDFGKQQMALKALADAGDFENFGKLFTETYGQGIDISHLQSTQDMNNFLDGASIIGDLVASGVSFADALPFLQSSGALEKIG